MDGKKISQNPIKGYDQGYPCKIGEVIGRIVGEASHGSWGEIDGVRKFSIPKFSTPHGTVIELGVLYLSELEPGDEIALKEFEQSALERTGVPMYAGLYTPA